MGTDNALGSKREWQRQIWKVTCKEKTHISHSWLSALFSSVWIWIVPLEETELKAEFEHSVNVRLLYSLYYNHRAHYYLYMRLGWYGHAEEVKLSSHNQRQGMKLLLEMPKDTCKCLNHTNTHTLWLSKLVEDHNVMGVIKVFSKGMDVFPGQPVGHEDCCFVSVCPVNTILRHRRKARQVRTSLLESCKVWLIYLKAVLYCKKYCWILFYPQSEERSLLF